MPLPETIPVGVLDKDSHFPVPCPFSLFADQHPQKIVNKDTSIDGRTTPFYRISTDTTAAYIDPVVSQSSVDKLVDFDANPSVMICLAHDGTMMHSLPTLNNNPEDDLNSWKERGYKEKTHWGWLNELPRNGKPGKEPAVEGFWRDMQPWPEAKEELRKMGEKSSKSGL